MTKLTTERLEKLQDNLLQFQDAYSDPADKENYDIFVDALHVLNEFKAAKEKLLAYEQAAKNSADLKTLVISEIVDFYAGFESPGEPETVDEAQSQLIKRVENVFGLAAPVLPKQPEPTISFYRDGIIAAAKWVENQRDAYDNEHGQSDPDTGAFEFGNDAQLEYSTTLSEIAEGILSLHPTSAQPVSEPKAVGYFSYGSECGFDWHKTEKEAIESAEAAIDDYRGDACDGWSEETDSVCWGVILQQATKVDERPRADDDKCVPAIDTVCDYALLPEQESE